jgi:hypothetical protein
VHNFIRQLLSLLSTHTVKLYYNIKDESCCTIEVLENYNSTGGGNSMKHIEFTEKESALLAEILESSISDLKTERGHTDKREMRLELKEREAMVIDLLQRIKN